ncbi:helix-turn-helix domain-containing protein [Microbulbifer taiwanensis]|uniref:Helix-turn-helix domain-containing protein n=1 Tax=Microbulbifer taiwanensis TaxID=986746 RepID=A0ABW1YSK4_9GAMM|nr:helix-turn-helix domain-containing protein [Microbulbifer taiwanensis]
MSDQLFVSYARALVDALRSEDAAPLGEVQAFIDSIDDCVTLPVSRIMDLDQLSREERLDLLNLALNQCGIGLENLDRLQEPELASNFQIFIWLYFLERALNNHQAISGQMELTRDDPAASLRTIAVPDSAWFMIYIERGRAVLEFDGRRKIAEAPELLLFKSGLPIHLERHPDCEDASIFTCSFFPRKSWIGFLHEGQQAEPVVSLRLPDSIEKDYIHKAFCQIIDVSHSDLIQKRQLHLNLLEQILLLFDNIRPKNSDKKLDPRVAAACSYILERYNKKITVENIASAANTSSSTLAALFREQLGVNVMRWRDQVRVQKAKEMLKETDIAIKVIAHRVGYEDPMFFSRRFKQLTGWSPTQVRQNSE